MGKIHRKGRLFFKALNVCLFPIIILPCSAESDLVEINRVVAKVNERVITWGEIERDMDRLNFSDEEKRKRASEFVDGKIERMLSIDAFTEKGIIIQDSYVEQEYNKRLLQDFNGDRRLFREVLQDSGQSQMEFREDIKENIMHMHMLSKRKRLREEISPSRVEEYYKAHSDQFKTDRQIRLGEIVLSMKNQNDNIEDLKKRAISLRNKIKTKEDFNRYAAITGESPLRENSGDWGVMVKMSEIRSPRIRENAFKLKSGEVSAPFLVDLLEKNPNGTTRPSGKSAFYIITILEERPAGSQSLDDVREEIERALASQIESEEQKKWLSRRKRDTYVEVSLP